MPPAWLTVAATVDEAAPKRPPNRPPPPRAPESAADSGANRNFRAASWAKSATIELTRLFTSSLPVLTNSPTASSALRNAPTRVSPMPLPRSFTSS